MIDQHTVRAFLVLTRGEVNGEPKITWDLWRNYVTFFQDAVVAAGFDQTPEERCYVDRALFAWGKSLKYTARSNEDFMIVEPAGPPLPNVSIGKDSFIVSGQAETSLADKIVALHKTGKLPTPFSVQDVRKYFQKEYSDTHIRTVLANYCEETGYEVKQGREARFRRVSPGKYVSI